MIKDEEGFHFLLQKLGQDFNLKKFLIPYQPIETLAVESILEPPELLIKWLGGCTKEEQEGFLKVRNKILTCNRRMKEIVDKKTIQYGSGKTKLCAEICFQQKSQNLSYFCGCRPQIHTYGVLHLSSPKQWSYVVWASIAGLLLGYSALESKNLLVPIVAHITTNLVSSTLWKWRDRLPSDQ